MKVLIATGLYPPDIGGPATYVKTIEKQLPLYKEGGVIFAISVLPFARVRHLPKVIRHGAYFSLCFFRALRADIIFAQNPVSVGFPAMLVAKILHKPFFLRLGGDYAWEQARGRFGMSETLDEFAGTKGKEYPRFIRLLKWTQRHVATSAEKVIVPSAYLKSVVERWGVPGDCISVVYNAFQGDFTFDTSIEKNRNEIITIGRFVPWKGFKELITALPEIHKDVPGARITIVGDGPQERELHDLVKELNLSESVHFTGALKKEDLLERLAQARVFVLNTAYEGFSHLILEAFAARTPVVTTNVCGNPEVIQNEKNGLLYHLGGTQEMQRAIVRVLQDDALAVAFADNAEKTLETFTVERMVESTAKVLLNK